MTKDILAQVQNLFNDEILKLAKHSGVLTIDEFEMILFQKLMLLGGDVIKLFAAIRDEKIRKKYVKKGKNILTRHGRKKTKYRSLFGDVEIRRSYYWKKGKGGVCLLDDNISLPRRCYSYNLQKLVVMLFVNAPSAQARLILSEIFNLKLCDRSLLDIFLDMGKVADRFLIEQDIPPLENPEDLLKVVCIDGTGVKLRPAYLEGVKGKNGKAKTKEAVVCSMYAVEKCIRTEKDFIASSNAPEYRPLRPGKPQGKTIMARLGDKEYLFKLAAHTASKYDISNYNNLVFLSDGARCPELKSMKYFRRFTHILDIYHVMERLGECALVFHRRGSSEARKYRDDKLKLILTGRLKKCLKELESETKDLDGTKRETMETNTGYFKNHECLMKYKEYLKKGYPIGSGSVEAACKNLVKQRMNGSGMFWSWEGAQAMLNLRAIHLNGDIGKFMKYFIEKDQILKKSMKNTQKSKSSAKPRKHEAEIPKKQTA